MGEVSPSTPAGTPFTARNYFQWYAASGPATGGLPTMRIAYSSGTVDNEEGWDKLDPRTALPVEVTRHVAIYWDSALDQVSSGGRGGDRLLRSVFRRACFCLGSSLGLCSFWLTPIFELYCRSLLAPFRSVDFTSMPISQLSRVRSRVALCLMWMM